MSPEQVLIQETFRCAACPGPVDMIQSFLHFKDLSLHSMAVHMVALERAVQASTLLPTTLNMFVCKLCPPEMHSSFLTEGQLQSHLVKHSEFFAKRWKEFSEVQCRVCEKGIDQDLDEDHMSIAHPRSLFADPKEVNTLKIEEVSKISSQQSKSLSGGIRLKPIDLLLDQSKKQSDESDCRAKESSETSKACTKPAIKAVTKPSEMKPNQLSLVGVKKHVSAEKIKNYFSRNGVLVAEVNTRNGTGNVTFVTEEDTIAWSGKVISIDDCQIRISTKWHYPADLRENELIINKVSKSISVDDLYDFFSRKAFYVDQIFLQALGFGRVLFRTREDADYWADQAHKLIVRGIQIHIWRPVPSIEISESKYEDSSATCSTSDQGKESRRQYEIHSTFRRREREMNYRGWAEVDNGALTFIQEQNKSLYNRIEVDNDREGSKYGKGHGRERSRSRDKGRHRSRSRDNRRHRSRSRDNRWHRSRSRDSCRPRERSWSRFEGRYRNGRQIKYRNRYREGSSSRFRFRCSSISNTRERSTSWSSYAASLDEAMKRIHTSRSRLVGE